VYESEDFDRFSSSDVCHLLLHPITLELMALAIALTTQCPYCLQIHKGAAINAGATKEELAETIAWTLRAGAAITHGTHLMGER
jgi:AhpD family alkylhydroperoxidase